MTRHLSSREQCDGCIHDIYEKDTNAQYCSLDMGKEYYEDEKECPSRNYGNEKCDPDYDEELVI